MSTTIDPKTTALRIRRFPRTKLRRRVEAVMDELREWESFYAEASQEIEPSTLQARLLERIHKIDKVWHLLIRVALELEEGW